MGDWYSSDVSKFEYTEERIDFSFADARPDELASLNDIVDFVSVIALPIDASKSDDMVSVALVNSYAGWLVEAQ